MTTLIDIMSKAGAGEYGDDSALIGKMAGIIHGSKVEHGSWGPFICGTLGLIREDGLHDGYLICPTFGADVRCTATFRRFVQGGKDDMPSVQGGKDDMPS